MVIKNHPTKSTRKNSAKLAIQKETFPLKKQFSFRVSVFWRDRKRKDITGNIDSTKKKASIKKVFQRFIVESRVQIFGFSSRSFIGYKKILLCTFRSDFPHFQTQLFLTLSLSLLPCVDIFVSVVYDVEPGFSPILFLSISFWRNFIQFNEVFLSTTRKASEKILRVENCENKMQIMN